MPNNYEESLHSSHKTDKDKLGLLDYHSQTNQEKSTKTDLSIKSTNIMYYDDDKEDELTKKKHKLIARQQEKIQHYDINKKYVYKVIGVMMLAGF